MEDYPVAETPKKNNTAIIITVVVIVVLLCCCCPSVLGIMGWLYQNGDAIFGL